LILIQNVLEILANLNIDTPMTEENTPSQPPRSSGKEVESNVLLAELNLSASELLFSSFLYYLGSNPISTQAFIESLCSAQDWIEEPQKTRIVEVIKSAISSDHLTDDQYVLWECAYANLS